jgi:hypothetical protein
MESTATKYAYRLVFKVKLLESSGDSFQRLVSRVLEFSEPGFQSVSPWGPWGDGGNDGWVAARGHYFQVFGPKPNSENPPHVAVTKSIEDFKKLPEKWQQVRRYTFVLNDRFEGIPALLASSVQALSGDGLDGAECMGTAELHRRFMELEEDKRQDIVGGVPDDLPEAVDARAMGDLLRHLADRDHSRPGFLAETAPDFSEKIRFNGLTPAVGQRLQVSSYQVSVINEFLAREAGLSQAIAHEIRELYNASAEAVADAPDAPDARYWWMIERIVPPVAQKHPHTLKAYRSAAEIVLAKYFETCDAYEHPDSTASA